MTIHVRYFAVFREQAGKSQDSVSTNASSPAELYRELGLELEPSIVRVSVNGNFREMDSPLHDGDEVVFIPPVAGG